MSDAFWNNVLVRALETSLVSSPFLSLFLMAQIKAYDKGYLSREVNVRTLIENKADVHNLFPKKYLQKNGLDSKNIYNHNANYVYIPDDINRSISDRARKEYFLELKKQCDNQTCKYGEILDVNELKDNLKSNCIPEEIFNMEVTDYQLFLKRRRVLITKK